VGARRTGQRATLLEAAIISPAGDVYSRDQYAFMTLKPVVIVHHNLAVLLLHVATK
jgi:hypothetical protein